VHHNILRWLKKGGRQSGCWLPVEIEEAYIYCAKPIFLLAKLGKPLHWETYDKSFKVGDFFLFNPEEGFLPLIARMVKKA
jgi:hypothetical protein